MAALHSARAAPVAGACGKPRAGHGQGTMKLLLIIGSGVAAVGLFLLATASGDTAFFAQQYPLLLALNAALAVLLAALVIYQLAALARRYRARVFGTRLTWRLFLRFAALAVLPGLIVYAVSVQFITRSIESWFDVKVDAALEGGMNLGQQAIDQMQVELQAKARAMALELGDAPATQLVTNLERLRLQAGVREALLVSARGRLLAAATEDTANLVPELPTLSLLRQARAQRGHVAVEAQPGKGLWLRAIVPVEALALAAEARFLPFLAPVPPCRWARPRTPRARAQTAGAVEASYRFYRDPPLPRDGLKRIYIVTLS